MLFDRIAMRQGQPQRYGTQMVCEDHHYVPYRMEAAGEVDARRRAVGFKTTLVQYEDMFKDNPPCVSP